MNLPNAKPVTCPPSSFPAVRGRHSRWLGFLLLIACLGTIRAARAQSAGSLDTAFNPTPDGAVYATVVQPDGKLLLGGDFTRVSGVSRPGVARLNADGSVDANFVPPTVGVVFSRALAIAVQPDGKVLVAGNVVLNGSPSLGIARLNADGSVDLSFKSQRVDNLDGGVATAIVAQPDGKILFGGAFTMVGTNVRGHLVRLLPTGSVDQTFTATADGTVSGIVLQGDGKIVLGGSFAAVNGVARNNAARLNADGSLDTGFSYQSGILHPVTNLQLQPDGKIVANGGYRINGSEVNTERLNPDGSLDVGYNDKFIFGNGIAVNASALQPDGKLIFVGRFSKNILRLDSDGSQDTTFNPGIGSDAQINTVALQPDGKIIISGNFGSVNGITRNGIARLNGDTPPPADPGAVSPSFDPKGGTDSTVRAIVFQPDGRVLIGGAFTSYQGSPRAGVARLNADGSLDEGFAIGTGADDTVNALLLQADGKVVVGGDFASFNGTARNGVVRLNPDGSVDASFDLGLDPGGRVPPFITRAHGAARVPRRMARGKGVNTPGFVAALGVDAKGKLAVGGAFASQRGSESPFLARVTADTGAPDPGFVPGAGAPDGPVRALAVQPDGKVVLGGLFSSTGATARQNLARLNDDGSPDLGFDPGAGAEGGAVEALLLQDDGAIVLGGDFVRAGGQPRARLAKVTAKGNLDGGFGAESSGADRTVRALAPAPEGAVLVGGDFATVDGAPAAFLARVQSDGRADAAFNAAAAGTDAPVAAIAVSAKGNGSVALVGGDFSRVANTSRAKLALVDNSAPSAPALPPFFSGGVDVGGGFSYLPSFGYYKLLPQSPGYVYHNDLGFLFYIDARDGRGGAYFYDFATTPGGKSLGFFYTSPSFPFPYLYSFELNAFLYYFPEPVRGEGFYTSSPRIFSRLDTGEILFQ